ncbi:fluoride efflux transporter CrcB [Aeribacillus pallidus]|uniref:fluoride efflux transporter CrcB n=1 Tax=Aeribacillus pallidus TaxID=33936 RepID=UPI003D1ED6AD
MIWVIIGGALGAAGRYLLTNWIGKMNVPFPIGTLTVNLLGSFGLGWVVSHIWSSQWKSIFLIGICGAFTTYSSFMLDAIQLWKEKRVKKFVVYLFLSIVGSFSCFLLGYKL